jgi:hypothetical protein
VEALLSHCSAQFSGQSGLMAVFFLGGLAGSLTHCLVMCGPMVACPAACGGACGTKFSMASQWHYHLGRLFVYGALGFMAALLSRQIAASPYWTTLSGIMMALAALLFIASSLMGTHNNIGIKWLAGRGALARGMAMSFMPCGLLYAALMAAASLANPIQAMVAMWLFVLGTMPVLLASSGFAAALAFKWQRLMHTIGRFGMAGSGLTLLVLAARSFR